MFEHTPGADGRCRCIAEWRALYASWEWPDEARIQQIKADVLNADGSASPVPNVRVYAADSASVVPGASACCDGGES